MATQEIISLHIGQAGIQFGKACWELFCLEHGVNPDGSVIESEIRDNNKIEAFFWAGPRKLYFPRAVLADLDPSGLDAIKKDKRKKTFTHSFSGKEDSASTYARAYYTIEDHVLDSTVLRVRKIAEASDYLGGFLLFHSVGGGTGSGFAARVMERLAPDYGSKTKMSFSLYPGDVTSASVVEPFNALLATQSIVETIDVAMMFSNDSLQTMSQKKLNVPFPQHKEFNELISQIVSSVTGTIRFDGNMNKFLKEFPINWTPFPKLRFIAGSFSPVESSQKPPKTTSINSITSNCLEAANQTMTWKPQNGNYLSCSFLFRGKLSESGVNKAISNVKRSKKVSFQSSMAATDIKVSMIGERCAVATQGSSLQQHPSSACCVANSTSFIDFWRDLRAKGAAMYDKKAYVHWYVAEGVEEIEFTEALECVSSLIDEYKSLSRK